VRLPAALAAAVALAAATTAGPTQAGSTATRSDLARSYHRFEQAMLRHPGLLERDALRLNAEFDRASLAFFGGTFASSCRILDGLTASIDEAAGDPVRRWLLSLRARDLPAALLLTGGEAPAAGSTAALEVVVAPLYPLDLKLPIDLVASLRLVAPATTNDPSDLPLAVDADGVGRASVAHALLGDRLGTWRVEVEARGHEPLEVARFAAVRRPLAQQRAAIEATLKRAAASTPALVQALATVRARLALLDDEPSPNSSAQFLVDPLELLRDVAAEASTIGRGEDPYSRRPGDLWRVLVLGRHEVPMRIFAPARLCAPDAAPAPLVVVLHGAGGDENMFMDGYGAGAIRRLAEERGFLVASPQTTALAAHPRNLDTLVDSISLEYAVDRRRIYVLGHSMGAGAAAFFAGARVELLAAVCCIAGGSPAGAERIAPTLVIVAERDHLVPAERLLSGLEPAIAAGLDLTVERVPDFGHTLVVTHRLAHAVDWLLGHARDGG